MGFKEFMQNFLYEESTDEKEEEQVEETAGHGQAQPAPIVQTVQPVQSVTPVQPVIEPQPVYDDPTLIDAQADALLSRETAADQGGSFLSRISESMDVNESEPEKPAPRHRTVPSRSAKPRRTGPKEEYSAVISPIFGNLPEEKKDHDALHDAINLPKPTEAIDMVEVISPMYGSPMRKASKSKAGARVKKAAPAMQEARSADLPATAQELEGLQETASPKDLADFLISGAPKARTTAHAKVDADKGSAKK